MKKIMLLFAAMLMLCAGCTNVKKSPIEGAWQLVYGKWMSADGMVYESPGNVHATQLKIWSDGYYAFTGHYMFDTLMENNYGGGKYTLEGNDYTEVIMYTSHMEDSGTKLEMHLEVRNDTLIQTWSWPADDEGMMDEGMDEGAMDEGTMDEGEMDEGTMDEGAMDEGTMDEGEMDEGTMDEGAMDEGTMDEGTMDEGKASMKKVNVEKYIRLKRD